MNADQKAQAIGEGIVWFLADSNLDRNPGFNVVTEEIGDTFQTTVYGVHAHDALTALTEYIAHNEATISESNGLLVVSQPA